MTAPKRADFGMLCNSITEVALVQSHDLQQAISLAATKCLTIAVTEYGSGHEGESVSLPGFVIKW